MKRSFVRERKTSDNELCSVGTAQIVGYCGMEDLDGVNKHRQRP